MNLSDFCTKFEKYKIKSSDVDSKTKETLGALSDTELKEIFGLAASATKDDVRLANRKAMMAAHPDKNVDDPVTAQGVFTNLNLLKTELDGRFDGTRRQTTKAPTAAAPTPKAADEPAPFAQTPKQQSAPQYASAAHSHMPYARPSMAHSFVRASENPLEEILRDLCNIFSFGFTQRQPAQTAAFPRTFAQYKPQAHFDSSNPDRELRHGIRFTVPGRETERPAPDLFSSFMSQSFGFGIRQPALVVQFTILFVGSDPFIPLFCSKGFGLSDAYQNIQSPSQIPQTVPSAGKGGGRY